MLPEMISFGWENECFDLLVQNSRSTEPWTELLEEYTNIEFMQVYWAKVDYCANAFQSSSGSLMAKVVNHCCKNGTGNVICQPFLGGHVLRFQPSF
jgi:hypothetical protein